MSKIPSPIQVPDLCALSSTSPTSASASASASSTTSTPRVSVSSIGNNHIENNSYISVSKVLQHIGDSALSSPTALWSPALLEPSHSQSDVKKKVADYFNRKKFSFSDTFLTPSFNSSSPTKPFIDNNSGNSKSIINISEMGSRSQTISQVALTGAAATAATAAVVSSNGSGFKLLGTKSQPSLITQPKNELSKQTNLCDYTNVTDFRKALAIDSFAALIAGFTVAPIINFVDTAIFFNASGKMSLKDGLIDNMKTFFKRPIWYMLQPSCLVMAGVYAGTYVVASICEDTAKHYSKPSALPQFLGASISNVGLGVTKDILYTKWFGRGEPRPVPAMSYGCYTLRDFVTIFAAFNLPPVAAKYLHQNFDISDKTAAISSQLLCPCAVQLLTTPIHLYGIDAYNNPNSTFKEHSSLIRQELAESTIARVGRIFAAFGMGGLVNSFIRTKGREIVFGKSNLPPIFG